MSAELRFEPVSWPTASSLPVMQAQSSLATAMTEESTGQYADLGLQLGDQSGYELSLKEQVGLLQTLTAGNSLVSTSLSTAQSALSVDQLERPDDLERPDGLDAGRRIPARRLQNDGPVGAAVAHRLGQRDVGRPVCVRRDQFRRRADGGLLFDPRLGRQDRGRSTRFRPPSAFCRAIRPRRASRPPPCRAFFPGRSRRCSPAPSWSSDWSSASSTNTSAEIAPGQTVDDLDQRQSTRLSGSLRRPTRC